MTAETWATLADREKDEAVARAAGWTYHRMRSRGIDKLAECWHNPADWPSTLTPFVSGWHFAGPLFDQLRADGWGVQFFMSFSEAAHVHLYRPGPPGGFYVKVDARGASAPDAICLAYCLARGAEKEENQMIAKPCPFCGLPPAVEPWHGGGPLKTRVGCEQEVCDVRPAVTGETAEIAMSRWNRRAA